MTNEGKARELSCKHKCEDCSFVCTNIRVAAIEMAEWKDEQFKQFLRNKKAFYHNHNQREAASAINDVLLVLK